MLRARKDAGARKGVGVELASVGKRRVFLAILTRERGG